MAGKGKDEAGVAVAAMLLVSLRDEEAVAAELARRGYRGKKAAALLAAAKDRIIQAADVDRRVEFVRGVKEYDDQYRTLEELSRTAQREGDRIAAAAKMTEITTRRIDLLGVKNQMDAEVVSENVESEQQGYVRGHLEALGVTEKGLPLEELARQIAAKFAELMARADRLAQDGAGRMSRPRSRTADREAGGASAPEAEAGGVRNVGKPRGGGSVGDRRERRG